jgi:ActR/RegA family two-component response regulator
VLIQDLRLGQARRPDGIEIIKLVHERNPDTRIVVLTSYGSPEAEAEARNAGADAFLRKPKPLSQVAQVVQGLIESPRTRTIHSANLCVLWVADFEPHRTQRTRRLRRARDPAQPRTRVLRLGRLPRAYRGLVNERAVPDSLPDRSFRRGLG